MFKPRIGVLGRDAREWYAAVDLAAGGFDVAYAGPLPVRGVRVPQPPRIFKDGVSVAAGRQVLLGPVRAWQPEAAAALEAAVKALPPQGLVIMGKPEARVRDAAAAGGHTLIDLLERDDFALLNAVPTAEGAICEAIQAANVTLAGSKVIVIGYGRTGQVLAHRLQGLAARVWVAARSPHHRAAARAMGLEAAAMEDLPLQVADASFIFNTVPALVVTREVINACPDDLVIVDIASEPGGVDRAYAERRGLIWCWPLGIPGRVSPRTAGRILHDMVHTLLAETTVTDPGSRPPSLAAAVKEGGG